MSPSVPAPDQAHRDRAVAARGVNVLVDAGAGTGKTTLLVNRLVEMVAPEDDACAEVPLERIAALTFTRKAAGELRLRVRERLLVELALGGSPVRRERLSRALAEADTAFIGTIHGFADRLLRMKPVEARLSPSYEVVEDADALCHETFELLLQAAEAGRLAEELAGTACAAARAAEAEGVIRMALAAEVAAESREARWRPRHGLDSLFAGFILHRDVPPPDAKPAPFLRARLEEQVEAFRKLARASRGTGRGSRWMADAAARLGRIAALEDPVEVYREVGQLVRWAPKNAGLQRKRDFPDDPAGWKAWKEWRGDGEGPGYRAELTRPLWTVDGDAARPRLPGGDGDVREGEGAPPGRRPGGPPAPAPRPPPRRPRRCGPSCRASSTTSSSTSSRTPTRSRPRSSSTCASDEPTARRWQDVVLAPGKLTLVGDPKQSIYRFRRADISVYEAVRAIVAAGAAPARAAHGQLPLRAGAHRPPERALRRDPRRIRGGEARASTLAPARS